MYTHIDTPAYTCRYTHRHRCGAWCRSWHSFGLVFLSFSLSDISFRYMTNVLTVLLAHNLHFALHAESNMTCSINDKAHMYYAIELQTRGENPSFSSKTDYDIVRL